MPSVAMHRARPSVRTAAWRMVMCPPSTVTTRSPKTAMPIVRPPTPHWYV